MKRWLSHPVLRAGFLYLSLSLILWGKDPFSDELIREVQKRHDLGVEGDKEITKKLAEDLEKLTQEKPDNYLLLAYLGSTYTLRSRDAWPGPGKLRYLKDGLKLMDQAVEKDPQNIAVRFIRAVNNINLPAFCNRRDDARKDFQILLEQLRNTPPSDLNLETTQAIYYYAGLSYHQLGEPNLAREAWENGWKLSSDSVLGQKIQKALVKLKK